MATIYHNPRCSKSRQTLELLRSKGIEPQVVLYLEDKLDKSTLIKLIDLLGITAEKLVRKSEADFKDNFANHELSDDDYVEAMLSFPKLIERPVVVIGDHAVLGRPPENVLDLI